MNNLQQQIQQEQERLSRAREAQVERERAQRQAQADAQTVAESSRRLRQLQIKAAEQQFNHELATSNAALIDTHNALIAELYAVLDAYDLRKALELYPRLQASFEKQQAHKHWLVGLMGDESEFAADEVREQRYAEIAKMGNLFGSEVERFRQGAQDEGGREANRRYTRRMGQVPNAIHPNAALAQYVGNKPRDSNERQIAAGLCLALCGVIFNPTDGYSAQRETDDLMRPRGLHGY